MLNLEFFNRETNITAKVVCDSISDLGDRITTLEVEYPRFIHGEVMTHRALSKNSSSSRAIPIKKMLDQIESNMATPLYWGENKSGMQAVNEVNSIVEGLSKVMWNNAFNRAKDAVEWMSIEANLHKQVPNRLTEPFQMMKVVITGTDWDNFFNLRIHKDAQPEICMLAYKIYKAMEDSKPVELKSGEWHLPYVNIIQSDFSETYYNIFYFDDEINHTVEQILTLEEAIKISSSCCAQVSYRNTDMSLEKATKIFDMLVKADVLHASCFEHLATTIVVVWDKTGDTFPVYINKEKSFNVSKFLDTWESGVTHQRKDGKLCSGNLTGWVSYRQKLPNNTNWKFNFEERMKMFN